MKKNLFISFTSFIGLFFMISCSFDAKDNTPIKTNNKTEEPVLSSIYIKKQCEKTEYKLNDELDLYGIVVMGKYSDGSEIKLRGWTSEPANGSVLTTAGNINIKISYEAFTTSFNISVKQPSDSYFWGTWVKMDDGTEYEVFEYEIYKKDEYRYTIISSSENEMSVSFLGTFTKESENVMTCNNIPYFRKGKRNLSYTINVVDKRTKSFDSNSSSMGREAPTEVNDTLKMLVQSPNYPSYKKEYTVDPNGETVIEAPVADEPMDFIISNDDKLIVKSGFTAKEDGDSETITLVDSGIANLKITGEIETNDSNGYLYGNYDEGYELTLFASNIGDGDIEMVSCSISSEDPDLIIEPKYGGLIGIPILTFLKNESRREIAKLQIKYNNLTEPYVDAKIKVVVENDSGNNIENFINLKFFKGVLPITVSAKQPHDTENYNGSAALNGFVIYPDGYHQHFSVKDNNSKLLFVPTFGQKAYKLVFSGATASTNSNTEMCYSVVPASIVPKKVPTGGEDFTSALQFGEHNLRNNVEDNAFSVDEAFAAVLPSKDIDWYSVVMDSENYYNPFDNWYYVQYYSEYGECPEAFFIKGGESLSSEQLPELVFDGYKFVGWYKDSACSESFSGTVEEDTKLYAKWTEVYSDKTFVKVIGTKLYDENNSEFFIKSMGLGNDSFGERSELPIQHHTEESYEELAEMGFNTVRFYLTYKMFETNENPGVYNQKVFDWIDSNVEWAKKNKIHIILDMQTPQGGYQSKGEGLALFTDENNKTRLANLWGKIASYYKNCSTIIGYDLVNEPQVPFNTDIQTSVAAWSELAQSCIDEIRKVDTNHVIFVERVTAIRGETYMEPGVEQCYPVVNDNNFVFQAHYYEPMVFTHQKEGDLKNYNPQYNNEVVCEKRTGFENTWREFEYQYPNNTQVSEQDEEAGKAVKIVIKPADMRYGGYLCIDDIQLYKIDSAGNETLLRNYSFESENDLGLLEYWAENADQDSKERNVKYEYDSSNKNGYIKVFQTTAHSVVAVSEIEELEAGYSYKMKCKLRFADWTGSYCYYGFDLYDLLYSKRKITKDIEKLAKYPVEHNTPLFIGEFGCIRYCFNWESGKWASGVDKYLKDCTDVFKTISCGYNYHDYHELNFGLYLCDPELPVTNKNTELYGILYAINKSSE